MSNHARNQWTPNQPETSNWTNNATGASFSTDAYKVGTSNVQGTRINTDKRLYFGNQDQFSIRFSSITDLFKIDYTDPQGNVTNVLNIDGKGKLSIQSLEIASNNIDLGTATYEYEVISADGIKLEEVPSTIFGYPTQTPIAGSMVYTQNSTSTTKSFFYIAIEDNPGGPA